MNRLATYAIVGCVAMSAAGQAFTLVKLRSFEERLAQPAGTPAARKPAREDRSVPFDATLTLNGRPVRGERTARLAIIEFGDFQCSFCRRFHQDIWPKIEQAYVSTGKVLMTYRHLPLSGASGASMLAAVATECAGQQNRFWRMHDLLSANGLDLDRPGFEARAAALEVDVNRFRTCMDGQQTIGTIQQDAGEAEALKIRSTPSFLIGMVIGDSVRVVRRISGAQPFDVFRSAIEDLLVRGQ